MTQAIKMRETFVSDGSGTRRPHRPNVPNKNAAGLTTDA